MSRVIAGNISLPFNLDVDELFSGGKAERILDLACTSLDAGMKKIFENCKKQIMMLEGI